MALLASETSVSAAKEISAPLHGAPAFGGIRIRRSTALRPAPRPIPGVVEMVQMSKRTGELTTLAHEQEQDEDAETDPTRIG